MIVEDNVKRDMISDVNMLLHIMWPIKNGCRNMSLWSINKNRC